MAEQKPKFEVLYSEEADAFLDKQSDKVRAKILYNIAKASYTNDPKLFKKLENGESADVLCRYTEYNINGDSLKSTNDNSFSKSTLCEKMTVRNTSGTFTASFVYGNMPNIYGTLSVPSGWLIPLRYINLGRLASDEDRLAHVKIIVPHNQGQPNATSNVYACFYDIVYQRGN